jgi:hypothetical protein
LIGPGEQLARHADQEDANRLGLPALERVVAAQQCHSGYRVVGQYGTLEQRGVGQKVVGLEVRESQLALGLFDPGLRGGPLAVGAVGLPGAQRLAGDVAEGLVVLERQEFALGMIVRGFLRAAHGHKAAGMPPVVGPIRKLALLPAGLAADRRPVLLGQPLGEPFELDLKIR